MFDFIFKNNLPHYKEIEQRVSLELAPIFDMDFLKHEDLRKSFFENVYNLVIANYRCYEMNNLILSIRRGQENLTNPDKNIASLEWQVRQVGELRVDSKNNINKILATAYNSSAKINPINIIEDDISYGVGEMIDRIIIESIKQSHYKRFPSLDSESKIESSNLWRNRVFNHLQAKVESIKIRGYYEVAPETRTYVIDDIA